MTHASDDLSPADFMGTAEQAVAACHGLPMRDVATRLAADGLLGVLAEETHGGLGLSLPYAVPIVAAASAGLLAFALAETILVAGLDDAALAPLIPDLVSGTLMVSIAWRDQASLRRLGDKVLINGTVGRTPCAGSVDRVLVALDDGTGVLVPLSAQGVTCEESLTLALENLEYTLTLDGVSMSEVIAISAASMRQLHLNAQILRSAAILGSAEKALSMAIAHVTDRRQFGKALVAHQAIRHMLARHKLSLEGIRQSIHRAFRSGATPHALEAEAAFVYAAREGVAIAEGAIQLHGGMGFTWDVITHRHLRQIQTVGLQGDSHAALETIAHRLIEGQEAAA